MGNNTQLNSPKKKANNIKTHTKFKDRKRNENREDQTKSRNQNRESKPKVPTLCSYQDNWSTGPPT
jgi:hypothetical protein